LLPPLRHCQLTRFRRRRLRRHDPPFLMPATAAAIFRRMMPPVTLPALSPIPPFDAAHASPFADFTLMLPPR